MTINTMDVFKYIASKGTSSLENPSEFECTVCGIQKKRNIEDEWSNLTFDPKGGLVWTCCIECRNMYLLQKTI